MVVVLNLNRKTKIPVFVHYYLHYSVNNIPSYSETYLIIFQFLFLSLRTMWEVGWGDTKNILSVCLFERIVGFSDNICIAALLKCILGLENLELWFLLWPCYYYQLSKIVCNYLFTRNILTLYFLINPLENQE
jgi:hypothetical protein